MLLGKSISGGTIPVREPSAQQMSLIGWVAIDTHVPHEELQVHVPICMTRST